MLPDKMTYIRIKIGSESYEMNANYVEGDNIVTVGTYTVDEYGLYTAYSSVRKGETKNSKPGAFWACTKEGNTLTYRANGLKPLRIVLDDGGTVLRIERGDSVETVFTYAENAAVEGAVYQSETQTEKTHYLSYYDAEFREIYSYDFKTERERSYTAEDYCKLPDPLKHTSMNPAQMQLKHYSSKGDDALHDSCEVKYDEKGNLISHTHTDQNGTVQFSQNFLREDDEIPKDDQEYLVLDKENRLVSIVKAHQGDQNYWTLNKTLYGDVPVMDDPLWIAYHSINKLN